MIIQDAIFKCFEHNTKLLTNHNVLEIINDYDYCIVGGKTPSGTISCNLANLTKEGRLKRVKNPKVRGYLYHSIDTIIREVIVEGVVVDLIVVDGTVEETFVKEIVTEKENFSEKEIIEEEVVEKETIVKKVIVAKEETVVEESGISLEDKFESVTGLVFPTFYTKYKPKLVWYLTKYTRDQEVAEDFADDAFTQSLLKIDNYNNEKSQIHTWVYKIAENLVKKDFKDKQKMSVVSLDKETGENLNLINIIPNGQHEDTHVMERDKILIRKADIVKDAIFSLPEKYKKVMILRELENKPYIDIAEICVKELNFEIVDEIKVLPSAIDFSLLKVESKSTQTCYINITYLDGVETVIQFKIEPFETFELNKLDIENITGLELVANGELCAYYKLTTNLSTIKSQISKGRQLIQSIVSKRFKILDDQGLH